MPAQHPSSHHQGRKHHRHAWQRWQRQQQAQQPGRPPARRAVHRDRLDLVVEGQNGDTFGIAACSRCACVLPGSETSQRLHTIWHETVLGIDSRTAR